MAAAWRALRRLFFSPLGIDRSQGQLHVGLKPEEAPAVVDPAPAPADAPLLATLQGELKALLSQRSDTRKVLRHLAVLETQLRREGWAALEDLPLDVLGKALEQLESLSSDFGSPGLGALHSRLQLALLQREEASQQADHGHEFLSDFGVGRKVLVDEGTPSNFDSWRSTLPAPGPDSSSAPAPTPDAREAS